MWDKKVSKILPWNFPSHIILPMPCCPFFQNASDHLDFKQTCSLPVHCKDISWMDIHSEKDMPMNEIVFKTVVWWGRQPFLFFFFLRFIYFRNRDWGKNRGRESSSRLPHWAWRLMGSLITVPWDQDLSWNQESDTWLSYPDAPGGNHYLSNLTNKWEIATMISALGKDIVLWGTD